MCPGGVETLSSDPSSAPKRVPGENWVSTFIKLGLLEELELSPGFGAGISRKHPLDNAKAFWDPEDNYLIWMQNFKICHEI